MYIVDKLQWKHLECSSGENLFLDVQLKYKILGNIIIKTINSLRILKIFPPYYISICVRKPQPKDGKLKPSKIESDITHPHHKP